MFGLLLIAGAAQAQVFVGSDNFNDNTLTIQGAANQAVGQWRGSSPNSSGTGGAWTETSQQMNYTNSTTTGFNKGVLIWVSPSTSINSAPSGTNLGIGGAGLTTGDPYNSSWTAQVSVTNTLTSLTNVGSYSYTGFEIYDLTSTNGSNAYYGISISTAPSSAKWIVAEWGKWDSTLNAGAGGWVATRNFISTTDTTDVQLRMTYDGTAKSLVLSYSNDGLNFVTGATYALTGAEAGFAAPSNNGFGLELFASVNNIGSTVTAGQMAFDNLSVSAIPEPSTYAAIFGGFALVGAVWHRRRQRAVTTN